MLWDKNDALIRTAAAERTDAALYGILRLFSASKTERKLLKKNARAKKRDARRIKRLTGEKSRADTIAILLGIGEYLLFGKEAFYRQEAVKERRNGRRLASRLEDIPKLERIVIHSEKRARREEKYSGRIGKIAVKEGKKNEKSAARRTRRAKRRVDRYFRRRK